MSILSQLRTLLVLGRVSNLPTVWTNVLVGWFLSGGGIATELGWILAAVSLVYVAGMTLNDAFDAHWDRQHAPARPIPSGKIGTGAVWAVGALEMAAGVALWLWKSSTHPALVAGLVAAILLYNWLHKRWAGSVLVMGLCRALVYIGAGSAVAAHTAQIQVPGTLYLLAVGVVLYIAGLTLAARSEHLAASPGLWLLPRLMLSLPVLFPPIAHHTAPPHPLNFALVVVGVIAVAAWVHLVRRTLARQVPKGIALAIAGIALFDAAVVAFADWRAAVAALACFALALALQRVVPAT